MTAIETGADGHEALEAFGRELESRRRELVVHCYRMTGSHADAEDLVQETFLRAVQHRTRFEGRASTRTWLYRIATNACLDFLESSARRSRPAGLGADLADVAWLQPLPTSAMATADDGSDPEATVLTRETIEIALLAALQVLPPRQRAVFIARDLVGLTPTEASNLLDTTVDATNSLVQRARRTMRAAYKPTPPLPDATERAIVDRYIAAHEAGDYDAMVALLHRDITVTMPPEAPCIGSRAAREFFRMLFAADGPGDWRVVPIEANRQPATANYLRLSGQFEYRATSIDVLRFDDARITAINSFLDPGLFANFGLPASIQPDKFEVDRRANRQADTGDSH
jgi:RNA polymerase sigma-70 factor, ECF subfamily